MQKLLDLNVWMALAVPSHPQHKQAREWLKKTSIQPADLLFCLPTEMGLLRLLTQVKTMQAFGLRAMTNEDAVAFLRAFQADASVSVTAPPGGTRAVWLQFAAITTASPNFWMDAYLAALAITLGAEMVTFDSGFQNFSCHGLKLNLLHS